MSGKGALTAFREAIEANNNKLLANVRASVSRSDLPHIPIVDYGEFAAALTDAVQAFATSSARDSVRNAVVTELVSGVGGAAAAKIVGAIGTRIPVMVATSSAAGSGATGTGAAVGAKGGSLGGPAGTVVGFGVGVVVGVAIDWWMTARFEEKLAGELNKMVDRVQSLLIDETEDGVGLRTALDDICDVVRDAYQESLHDRIVKEPVL